MTFQSLEMSTLAKNTQMSVPLEVLPSHLRTSCPGPLVLFRCYSKTLTQTAHIFLD